MEVTYRIKIKGHVTGVGFRYSTMDMASKFPSIQGYVRNASYGEVEIFMQGDDREVDKMLEWLKGGGPSFATIDSFEIEKAKHDPSLSGFIVL